MPRASTSTKRQQGGANQRDTRHENGLVGPGRPVSRNQPQHSDGGHKSPADNASPSVRPSPLSTAAANGLPRPSENMPADHKPTDPLGKPSLDAYSESGSSEPLSSQPANMEENHRRIDVNAAKNVNVHRDPGPLDFAMTVLRSCPLYDTIAILIILMQLSPTALSAIYMLFTLLTFVPPVTTSSGLSLTEIFEGTLGTPSLTTLVCMDIVVLLVWLFLWGPLQNLILDFAQIVIALTLGGGATSRQGSTNNVFLSLGIVILSHVARHSGSARLTRLTSLLGADRFASPDQDDPLEPASRMFGGKWEAYSWFRNSLAIHILTQGVVRYIREWYLRREKREGLSQNHSDPEAGKSPFSADGAPDGGFNPPDFDANLQAGTSALSGKKRRKQSAQVRIRQPLWAALASTKIVMVKEYELSHAASESAGSNATDVDNLGNAPFNTQPEQIWICYVGSDEVCFNTSHFPDTAASDECRENNVPDSATWIDTSKPFYVRVNHAIWQPTRILPVCDGDEDQASSGSRWTGDIYGLTPMSSYECEFVSTRTGAVLFSTSIRTIQAKSRDADPAKATNSQRRRHESPVTTIKASIAAQEAKLNDEKAKLKALRKENNRRTNAIKKEIDKLATAVQSAGGNDEKLRQKITQNNIQQKQAEQSIQELEDELKELATVPAEVIARHKAKQREWNAEKAQYDSARAEFKSFKNAIDREIKALEEEQASMQAKRNKIATRLAKADNEHAQITDANSRGLDEAERRRQERAALEADITKSEKNYHERLAAMQAKNNEKAQNVSAMAGTMSAYVNSFRSDETYSEQPVQDSAFTSQTSWAGASPSYQANSMWSTMPVPPSGPSMVSGAPPSLLPPHQLQYSGQPPVRPKTRGRSSSMLSDVSGFTQSSNADDDYYPGPLSTNNNSNHYSHHHQQHHHHHYQHGGSGTNGGFVSATASPFIPSAHLAQGSSGNSSARLQPGLSLTRPREDSGSGSGFGSGSGEGVSGSGSGSGCGSGDSGSGSGSGSGRSSVHSGSGSAESNKDPMSPV